MNVTVASKAGYLPVFMIHTTNDSGLVPKGGISRYNGSGLASPQKWYWDSYANQTTYNFLILYKKT